MFRNGPIPSHAHVDLIAFLDSIAKRYSQCEIHLICDNYGTHTPRKVVAWLEAHPRLHIHCTPTSASWLNLVESWFSVLTRQAISRGSFDSVRRLERAITKYIAEWNEHGEPFHWTMPVREIRRKIRRVKAIPATEY